MITKIPTLLFVILFAHLANHAQASDTKLLSIGLNASGEILIISPDGKKLGYDAAAKKTYDEIKGATTSTARDREPVYKVPFNDSTKDLTIRVFGKTRQTKGDLGISGNGFILRTIGLALEPRKVFTVILRPDLSKIQFSANSIVENPTFNLAIDPPAATDPSYIFKLTRSKLALKKTMTIALNLTAATLNFSDNGLPKNTYSLQATKINAEGGEQNFTNPKIISIKANRFQFDFKNWDEIINGCLKIDENADGFGDEKCEK
ncbi:MAG: hypothetical protein M3Q99_05220 [Acidobacteriota bacterium]|nr:hypothetical protein [Acidobacteriota bacterium]